MFKRAKTVWQASAVWPQGCVGENGKTTFLLCLVGQELRAT